MALRVIGAGFGRTGTHSLKLALEQLGLAPCHHMYEVRQHPEQLAFWQAAAHGELPDWDEVFAGFAAQVDWPGARFWRELAEHFPDAKVILSVRPADEWFDSLQATIGPFLREPSAHDDPDRHAHARMVHELIGRQIFDDRVDDRVHAIGVFRDHIAEVQRTIAPERLLTYQVAEGWGRSAGSSACRCPIRRSRTPTRPRRFAPASRPATSKDHPREHDGPAPGAAHRAANLRGEPAARTVPAAARR
jgi:Sulfotransferase domain